MNQALSLVEGAESPRQKQGICESLCINISQSMFQKTLVPWEINRLQRKESCDQISLGNPRLNKIHLFSLLLGFLVFSVLVFTIKLQAQGMVSTISQAYLMKEPFRSSEHFSGLVINKFIHSLNKKTKLPQITLMGHLRKPQRPQLESYRIVRSLSHE